MKKKIKDQIERFVDWHYAQSGWVRFWLMLGYTHALRISIEVVWVWRGALAAMGV